MAVVPDILASTSPLLNTTGLEKRKKIDVAVKVATIAGGGGSIVLAANAALEPYKSIATIIKSHSNANSCTLEYGTDYGHGTYEGYAFYVTTTGKNCDTTALYKTILKAVKNCADRLHNAHAIRGCCNFTHGGTWHGHLKLSGNPSSFPANGAAC